MQEEKVEMIRAAFYGRYSSHLQNYGSIEAQQRAVQNYAEKNNMVIVQEYVDIGVSGRSLKGRKQMKQLLADSGGGVFDVVLVHKMDRFSRNLRDSENMLHVLHNNGVRLISISENFDDSVLGDALRIIMGLFNELFSKTLEQR